MGEIHPEMAKFTPTGVIRGPHSPQNGPKCRNFKIVQIQDLIARSKNLAKADLMSPLPELSIFLDHQIALFRRVLPGGPSEQNTQLTNTCIIKLRWLSPRPGAGGEIQL
jgi:hypothetical protein